MLKQGRQFSFINKGLHQFPFTRKYGDGLCCGLSLLEGPAGVKGRAAVHDVFIGIEGNLLGLLLQAYVFVSAHTKGCEHYKRD